MSRASLPRASCSAEGLRGPLTLSCAVQEDWLEKAAMIIQARIERYAQSEIRFNLMAVIRDRREVLQEQLAALEARRASTGDRSSAEGYLTALWQS